METFEEFDDIEEIPEYKSSQGVLQEREDELREELEPLDGAEAINTSPAVIDDTTIPSAEQIKQIWQIDR